MPSGGDCPGAHGESAVRTAKCFDLFDGSSRWLELERNRRDARTATAATCELRFGCWLSGGWLEDAEQAGGNLTRRYALTPEGELPTSVAPPLTAKSFRSFRKRSSWKIFCLAIPTSRSFLRCDELVHRAQERWGLGIAGRSRRSKGSRTDSRPPRWHAGRTGHGGAGPRRNSWPTRAGTGGFPASAGNQASLILRIRSAGHAGLDRARTQPVCLTAARTVRGADRDFLWRHRLLSSHCSTS